MTEAKQILGSLLRDVENNRNIHLEIYASAFLQEVGSTVASSYVLVEQFKDNKITWSFEKREGLI